MYSDVLPEEGSARWPPLGSAVPLGCSAPWHAGSRRPGASALLPHSDLSRASTPNSRSLPVEARRLDRAISDESDGPRLIAQTLHRKHSSAAGGSAPRRA